MKKSIGIAVMLFVYSTASFASCTNSDLSGIWKLYGTISSPSGSVDGVPIQCSLNMPTKGNLIKADSTCSSASNDWIKFSNTTLSGTLKVDSKCHVTGQFSINIGKIGGTLDPTAVIPGINPVVDVDVERKIESKVDAFISKGKDSISGMMYEGTFTPPILSNGISQAVIGAAIGGDGAALLPVINQLEFTSSSIFTGVKL